MLSHKSGVLGLTLEHMLHCIKVRYNAVNTPEAQHTTSSLQVFFCCRFLRITLVASCDALFLLQTCVNEIRRHEFDTKVATIDIKQQQLLLEKKQEKLKAEQEKCVLSREKTQLFYQKQDQKHLRQKLRNERALAAVREEGLEKAVQKFHMPMHMRRRLMEHATD